MVQRSVIEARFSRLGIKISRWFRPEINELVELLHDNEQIELAVPGRYFAGFALLVATERRLLLLDKRAFFMTVEDIRYDMVSQINFSTRIYGATIDIFTLNKEHVFTSIKYRKELRQLTLFVQQRVADIRQHQGVVHDASTLVPVPAQPALQEPAQEPRRVLEPEPGQVLKVPYVHVPHNIHLPESVHLPRRVGMSAINGATTKFNPNPYMEPFLG